MTPPPLITGASLLIWGLQTGLWPFALPPALILESAGSFRGRWSFTDKDIMRMADLCALMIVGFAVFFLAGDSVQAVYNLIAWLPVCLFPLAALQVFHTDDAVDIRYLFFVLRKQIGGGKGDRPVRINLIWPYLIVCLIAAGAGDGQNDWYYPSVWLICAWALFGQRSRRFSTLVWLAILLSCGAGGYFGHKELRRMQIRAADWYMQHFYSESDPYKNQTAIGDIGSQKPSNRIVFRVQPGSSSRQPTLLREAAYDAYLAGNWFAGRHPMVPVTSAGDGANWPLDNALRPEHSLSIAMPLNRGRGLLKLPYGTVRIEDLPANRLHINRMGTVRVEEGPGLAVFKVLFDSTRAGNHPPAGADLSIPAVEIQTLAPFLPVIKPPGATDENIVRNLNEFFQTEFRYSLSLERPRDGMTALGDFLTDTRSGHCEYFATAAVLLLRMAGIPARYAAGYAVFEDGRFGEWRIVRQRHAHAWAEAHVNGRWIIVDATPPDWTAIDAATTSSFEPLRDLWSHLAFRVAQWRWRERDQRWRRHMAWLLIPLGLYLARDLFRRKQSARRKPPATDDDDGTVFPGRDSEFYRIETGLVRRGLDRRPGETCVAWLGRIGDASPIHPSDRVLAQAMDLHYRLRFDPRGIAPGERRRLADCVETLLRRLTPDKDP